MDEKIKRLEDWKEKGKSPPYTLDLNPTDLCNLQCKSCWQRDPNFKHLDSSYQLSADLFLDVVEQAIELGVEEFEITGGGEPLMRKELVLAAMRKIKGAKLVGNLTTNGTLFKEKDLNVITQLGWDQLTISLDGATAETHDYLRGKKGSFEQIMTSLRQLNDLKERTGKEKPRLKFNCVVSNQNYDQLEDLVELAHELDVEEVSFESLTVHSPQGKQLKLTDEERDAFACEAEQAYKLAGQHGINTNLSSLRGTMLKRSNQMKELMNTSSSSFADLPCYEPWFHLVIKVDGSANPCCLYDCQQANVKQKTLKQIWYGPTFQRIRQRIKQGNLPDCCQICNAGQFERNKTIRDELRSRA